MGDFRILLVDDEIQILKALERTFGGRGYTIYTATDAEAALELLDQEDIHMVLADQRMRGLCGVELLKLVRARYPWVVRMLVTAYANEAVAHQAYEEAGVCRVLAKPWESGHLRKLVSHARRCVENQRRRALSYGLPDAPEDEPCPFEEDAVDGDQAAEAKEGDSPLPDPAGEGRDEG